MAESNGNGVIKWLVQLLLPAALAVFGSYAAVTAKLAVLEERLASVRHEMQLANDTNEKAHVRLEQKDDELAAAADRAERRRK